MDLDWNNMGEDRTKIGLAWIWYRINMDEHQRMKSAEMRHQRNKDEDFSAAKRGRRHCQTDRYWPMAMLSQASWPGKSRRLCPSLANDEFHEFHVFGSPIFLLRLFCRDWPPEMRWNEWTTRRTIQIIRMAKVPRLVASIVNNIRWLEGSWLMISRRFPLHRSETGIFVSTQEGQTTVGKESGVGGM